MTDISPEEAKQIAEEAYIFAYPMLDNYKTMFNSALDENSSVHRAPLNKFHHNRKLLGPEFTEVVAPNNDTLYTFAWPDLGTEPLVLSLPEFPDERYFVIQMVDLYTHNMEYIGARSTGYQGGAFLIAGPYWEGSTPGGIDGVRRSEGRFVFLLGRTAVAGKDDIPNVTALQDRFKLTPLSEHFGEPAPDPAPIPDFPPYNSEKAASIDGFDYFDFLLGQLKLHPSEQSLIEKFAAIGIRPGKSFDPHNLDPEVREAVAEGVADGLEKIESERLQVGRNVNNWTLIGEGFGYRSMMQGKYLLRAAAGMAGLYGNNPEEAFNFSGANDADGEPLDASKHNYVIHFRSPPPAKAFWSVSMYKLPEVLFNENPINRYSIGDRTPGFHANDDGSMTIHLQHESPGRKMESSWLPAPDGPFAAGLRIYWPDKQILDGKWEPTAIKKAG